jgi:HAMP domain-containing protein
VIHKVVLLALLMPVLATSLRSQQANPNPAPEPAPQPSQSVQAQALRQAADVKTGKTPATTLEQIRQDEIEAETKKLYELSAELRAEVARTYKASLSLKALKKAEEVEALARSLRILMKQETAARH